MIENGISLKPHRFSSAESKLRNTRYHTASDFHVNHEVKQEQRAKVLEFLLDNHVPQHPIRFLGLPGLHWEFEKLFLEAVGPKANIKFRGVEHSWSILERSIAHMPGSAAPQFFSEETLIGSPQGFRTDISKIYFGSASALFSFSNREFERRKAQSWSKRVRRNTCIWMDFTSQLCSETRRAIENVSRMAHQVHHVPFVVTILYGRDDIQGGLEARERELVRLIDNKNSYFKPRQNWYYQSLTGARMATFCGMICRRQTRKRRRL